MPHRHPIFGLTVAILIALCFGATPSSAQTDVNGQWSLVTPLPYFPVHTHMLPTGKVMIWPGDGGVSGNDPRSWDPANGSVTSLSKPGYDLFCSGHSFLADGILFVAGGHIQNNVGLARASKYNPVTNAWSNLPNMNNGRWYPTTTVLANGDVLVVSGDVDLATTGVNTLPQVFQVATGTWRNLTSAQLAQDLYPLMLLAPNGQVFNAGPTATTRYLDTSGSGTWSFVATRVGGYRDYASAVMYAPGKVLVTGGSDPPTNTAEVIDLNAASPSWSVARSMQFSRRHLNTTLLPDGKVLVTGGTAAPGFNDASGHVDAAELWDPATGNWTTLASSSGIPRVYHSAALLLPDGRVLSTGGNDHPETEIYSPPYLFKGARPTITSPPSPSSVGYGQSFFVETPDALTTSKITMLRLSSVTHGFNQSQYINELSFSQATGGLNVVAPSGGAVAPPGPYLLFILNGNGVPSVANILQVGGPAAPSVPTLTSLTPSSATVGGPAFTLTTTGTNFVSGSVVRWNGANRTTTFVSATQLTAAIPATDIAAAGTAQVTVLNPGGAVSNSLTFTITGTSPVPVAHWKFDEGTGTTAADASGNGNTGTLVNGPVWTSGKIGSALQFDGTNDYVNVGNVLNMGMGSVSFGAWVKSSSGVTEDCVVAKKSDGGLSAGWQLCLDWTNNLVQARVSDGTTLRFTNTALPPVADGTWQHVFVVQDRGAENTIFLYVDGVPRASSSLSGLTGSTDSAIPLLIGAAFGAGDFFNGAIDDARVYSRALSASEVQALSAAAPDTPTLTTLSPSSASAGGPAFTLTTTGTNFVSGSVVRWNGANRTTTFVSATQLTAAIPATDIAAAGTAQVTVLNPGGAVSNSLTFTITGASPTPTLTTLSPSSATAGGPAFTLSTTGTNFVSGSLVRWNGADRTTTFVSATQLTAAIPATDIAAAGTAQVTVLNPGGAVSNSLTFTITGTSPVPVAHWKFDEGTGTTAADASGNGNTGTLVNGPVWTSGKIGSALQFDGTNDYVNVGNVLNMGMGSVSFGAWVKSSSGVTEDCVVAKKSDGGLSAGWQLCLDWTNNLVQARVSDGTTLRFTNTALPPVADGTWQHVFVVQDRGAENTIFLYVDGVPRASSSLSGLTGSTDSAIPLLIGAAFGAGDFFNGAIDDARVYSRALSASEVQALSAAAPDTPTLTTLSPSSASAGGPAFTLTTTGTNFVSGSVVRWNGANRTTTFVSATQLTAAIPATDIAAAGTAQVTVLNPGGAVSNSLTFTITGTSPVPVAHWKFDEGTGTTAADASGNGNTGTLVNGPVWTSGKIGSALQFDGTNDYVNVGNVLNMGMGSVSFGAWVKSSSGVTEDCVVAKKSDGGLSAGWQLCLDWTNNLVQARVSDGTTLRFTNTALPPVADGTWQHVFVVQDRGAENTIFLYVDGVPRASSSLSGLTGSTDSAIPLLIGAAFGAGDFFNGAIDDARVYSRALSASEVQALSAAAPDTPTLTTLSPSSASAGGPAFTLTTTGTNFVSGSVVRWNGANRTTTFVSATQLTAAIPATDIAAAGTAQVTVLNPGGAVSNALTFVSNAATTSTGLLAPSANAAVASGAGDNNGFQTTPSNAYGFADGLFAVDPNSGTNTNTSCTNAGKDKHNYYNYNFIVPSGVAIRGIEVRLRARVDSAANSPSMCVQLSWSGGASWTTALSTTTLSTVTTTYILGGATNTWARTWTVGDFSNANFRVRIIDVASSTARAFSLDGVAVQVTYQ